MVGGIIYCLTRQISYIYITNNCEITCSDDRFGPDILVWSMAFENELHLDLGLIFQVSGINGVGNWTESGQWSTMELGTVLSTLSERHTVIV